MKCYIESFHFKAKNEISKTVPCEKSKAISFASSVMKKNVACWATFPVKLTCHIDIGSASSACYLLKSFAIILQHFLE